MKDNWRDEQIAKAWSDAVGTYGDLFQQILINPFVLGVARAVKQKRFPPLLSGPGSSASPWSPEACFSEALITQQPFWNGARLIGELHSWHQKLKPRELEGIRLLDLGAGEGYLGSWLKSAGVSCLGIDCSDKLQNAGREKRVTSQNVLAVDIDTHVFDFDELSEQEESLESQIPTLSGFLPDLCTCVSVLDHLEHPERLLKSLRIWLGSKGDCLGRPLACVTLSPDFFFGAHQWDMDILKARRGDAVLGPASASDPSHPKRVTVYQRSWMQYEQMFTKCGYHVLWCHVTQISQFPSDVRLKLMEEARLKSPIDGKTIAPASGPFVFWIAVPLPNGEKAAFTDLSNATAASSCCARFALLDKSQQKEITSSKIIRHLHKADHPVLCAHNLSDGCLIVEKGTVVMTRNGQPKQTFRTGDFIGELESAGDFYVSRYLYPLHAGSEGASTLHLPAAVMSKLETVAEKTLPGQLFKTLRDRVATHSWIYHKTSGKGTNLFGSKSISDVTLEHCARAILFCATVELRTQPATNGLTVVALPEQLVELIRDSAEQNVGYDDALKWLNALGIVDAIPGGRSPYTQVVRSEIEDAWESLKVLCAELLLFPKDTRTQAEENFLKPFCKGAEFSYDKEHYDKNEFGFEVNQPRRVRLGKSFLSQLHALRASASQRNVSLNSVRFNRWLGNTALLKLIFFRRDKPVIIHINDMHFLRRIACSADGWQEDFRRRANLSSNNVNGVPLPYHEQLQDGVRIKSYLSRIHNFAAAYWRTDRDIGFSTDDHFARENAVLEFQKFSEKHAS